MLTKVPIPEQIGGCKLLLSSLFRTKLFILTVKLPLKTTMAFSSIPSETATRSLPLVAENGISATVVPSPRRLLMSLPPVMSTPPITPVKTTAGLVTVFVQITTPRSPRKSMCSQR